MATGDEPPVAPESSAASPKPRPPRRTDGADVGCMLLAALGVWLGAGAVVAALPLLGVGGPAAWHVGWGRRAQVATGVLMVLAGGLVAVLAFGSLADLVRNAVHDWRERHRRR